jgi:hypothetical protein
MIVQEVDLSSGGTATLGSRYIENPSGPKMSGQLCYRQLYLEAFDCSAEAVGARADGIIGCIPVGSIAACSRKAICGGDRRTRNEAL